MKRVEHAMRVQMDRLLAPSDLTRGSWYILYHVNEEGEISQRKLQDVLGIESGSLAILVDKLVRKGWLQRSSSHEDRRAKFLRVTPEGAARWKRVPDIASILRPRMMKGITLREAEAAVSVLKKVWENFEEEEHLLLRERRT
ncbi:MAG: MarR family winged helix-turn-helix transcriptional regulator [Thermoplasmata archaeon]